MTPLSFDDVRRIGLELPGVIEGTMYGAPALKINGHLMACTPSHKSAEPHSLVVRIDLDSRSALLEEDPRTFYITDHYVGYTSVLVRLTRIRPDQLRDLLAAARRFVVNETRGTRKAK
jgi:hypothetical protein